ncbi:rubredoxin [Methylobacillus caricis]|uniref:rubredoxin n=1 Tax=Methylobacillus caricis TaxID=1971611 RepID=UPI001CFFB4A7|nr:rubredoxin [Methylobacillus caricis]MCB5186649.1 rubredoxin [Methylobacillus caricis]
MDNYVWKCSCCDFVYDELAGQHEKGILPGTCWEALPNNWSCAICGSDRASFFPITLEEHLYICFGTQI